MAQSQAVEMCCAVPISKTVHAHCSSHCRLLDGLVESCCAANTSGLWVCVALSWARTLRIWCCVVP